MKRSKIKFSFDIDFQKEILRFIIQDKDGRLVLKRIKPGYLTIIEHSIIAEGLVRYTKKNSKIPSANILKQVIKELLESKEYVDLVTKEDIPNIISLIDNLYTIPLSIHYFCRDEESK